MQHQAHRSPGIRFPYQALLIAALHRVWAFIRSRPVATLAISALLLIAVAALLADVIATHDPLAQDESQRLKAPGAGHYFGTDGFGRDVFSRVVHGARSSLSVAFLAVGVAAIAGTSIGMFSAYWASKLDLLIQRLIDVLLGFPFLVLALIMVVALGPSRVSVAAAIALSLTPQVARLARASALSIKREAYVEAARVAGAGPYRIVWRHLLPNSFPPILAQLTGYFGIAIVAEAALSFLGLGVPPPLPSWGRMLEEGVRQYFEAAPWATVFPGLALSATVLSSALLGDALRDLLDPRRALLARRRPKDSSLG